jgi:hypothetical protein
MSSSTPSKSLGAGASAGLRSAQAAAGGVGGALPASAAGRSGAGPGAGRLRSDLTRPPSAGSMHRPPAVRPGGKDPAGQAAAAAGGGGGGVLGGGGGGGGAYDALGAGYAHTNALYGVDDAGAAAPARSREYAPGGGFGDEGVGPLTWGAAASTAMQHPARKLGAPSPFLQTHGDLWAPGDQDDCDDLALDVRAPTQAAPGADAAAAASSASAGLHAAAPPPAAAQQRQQQQQQQQQQQSALLVLPAWLRSRPFSTALHLAGAAAAELDAEADGEPAPDLRALPEAVREAALVDDLLYCFMGVPGRCIRPALADDGGPRYLRGPALAFAPAAALDERSAEVVRRLLPIPEYAAAVERFAVSRDRRVGERARCWERGVGGKCERRAGATACLLSSRAALGRVHVSVFLAWSWAAWSPNSPCAARARVCARRPRAPQPRARHGDGGAGVRDAGAAGEVAAAGGAARAARARPRRPEPQRAAVPVPGAHGVAQAGRRDSGGAYGRGEQAVVVAVPLPREPFALSNTPQLGRLPCAAPASAPTACPPGPPQTEASSQEITSAGLLNLLHRRLAALGGDAAGAALAERLLAAAAGPYFEILGRWLAEGVLDDPYCEFMVKARFWGGGGRRDLGLDTHGRTAPRLGGGTPGAAAPRSGLGRRAAWWSGPKAGLEGGGPGVCWQAFACLTNAPGPLCACAAGGHQHRPPLFGRRPAADLLGSALRAALRPDVLQAGRRRHAGGGGGRVRLGRPRRAGVPVALPRCDPHDG